MLLLVASASIFLPGLARADESGTDPANEPRPAPVRMVPPLTLEGVQGRTPPGPMWPAYSLEPGPRGEPVAYVVHPDRATSLLVVETVELPACRAALDSSVLDAAKFRKAAEVSRKEAEDARSRPPERCPSCGGWSSSTVAAWGLGGVAVGVVTGFVLAVSLPR